MENLLVNNHSSITDIAYSEETACYEKKVFVCRRGVNFIANDSDSYDLQVNFDTPVGRPGTITLKAGEVMSDLQISCNELYARGIGAPVPFRAVGS